MKHIIVLLALTFSVPVFAKKEAAKAEPAPTVGVATLKAEKTKGQVVFEAIGKPSFLKIKGQGEGPEGEITIKDTVTGTFKFKMATLDTGISLRNEHMKNKYLEVEKFPSAELKIEEVTKFNPAAPEAKGLPFKGTLTIHGVAKPISGTVDVEKKAAGYKVAANFETKLTDYAIAIPSYAGITVADSVKVSVQTELL